MSSEPIRGTDPLADLWRALSDPTRRSILELLRRAPQTTGAIASAFPQSRFAVMKHLDVLTSVGLVVVRRKGRERWNHLNAVPLQQLYESWVKPYEATWAKSLIRFKNAAEQLPQEMSMLTLAEPAAARVLTLELEIPIDAPRDKVWRMLTEEIHQWWPRDFYASSNPKSMRFETKLGGRLYEESADGGGVLWYTVIAVSPGVSVDIAGNLTTAFGGPAQTLLRLALREQGDQTVLELSDAVVGNVGDRTAATLEEGWHALFDAGFKQFVEADSGK